MSAQRDATVSFKLATSTTHRWMLELIVMEGNQAGKAGDFILGGYLDSCYLATYSLQHKMILTLKIFSSLFQIHGQMQSEVAACPQKVCFCEKISLKGMLGITTTVYLKSVSQFRRETFHLLAMTVDEYGYVYIICTCMYCDSDSTWYLRRIGRTTKYTQDVCKLDIFYKNITRIH